MSEHTETRRSSDGLVNVASGLGTNKSKRSSNQFVFDMLNDWGSLDAAYQSNWIARTIVDTPAADMTREWRRIKCEGAEDIEALEKELCLQQDVEEAIAWSRLYGGSGILMLTGQDLSKPLNLNKIKKGDLERFLVFDRWDLVPQTLQTWNVLARNYLSPEFYTIRGGAQTIHWSHIARFNGERLPRRWMQQTQGFGDSVLRKCIDDVMDMVASKDGVAELMQEANIDVINRQGLSDELASDEDESIIKRYEAFSMMKSNINMALLDGDEVLTRNTLNLSGVAPILETFITWISGAAKMPVTKLFGTSAKGMNATGEGDMHNYYDMIRGEQTSKIAMGLRVIDEVLVRSALGSFPEQFDYVWNPLSQPDQLETEQAGLLRAQRDRSYMEDGIVTKSQVQRELQADEKYQFEDEQIEELEGLEDANMFEELPEIGATEEQENADFVDAWVKEHGA
jgi:phage-related protein (TIGR01555 family)